MTLADIVLASTLLYPFKLVCDADSYLKPYDKVVSWFKNCIAQPQFEAVVGKIEMYKPS